MFRVAQYFFWVISNVFNSRIRRYCRKLRPQLCTNLGGGGMIHGLTSQMLRVHNAHVWEIEAGGLDTVCIFSPWKVTRYLPLVNKRRNYHPGWVPMRAERNDCHLFFGGGLAVLCDGWWPPQAEEERDDMEKVKLDNKRILFNLLPAHVAQHFLMSNPRNMVSIRRHVRRRLNSRRSFAPLWVAQKRAQNVMIRHPAMKKELLGAYLAFGWNGWKMSQVHARTRKCRTSWGPDFV